MKAALANWLQPENEAKPDSQLIKFGFGIVGLTIGGVAAFKIFKRLQLSNRRDEGESQRTKDNSTIQLLESDHLNIGQFYQINNSNFIYRQIWSSFAGSLKNLSLSKELFDLQSEPLGLVTVNTKNPKKCHALIEVHYSGLNFADIFAIQGLYSATPSGRFVPGLEFSGKILKIFQSPQCLSKEIKCECNKYGEGEFVFGCSRFGSYSSHLNASFDCIRHLPIGYSLPQGAAIAAQGLTAYYALYVLASQNFTSKSIVLIHSAAGGVGIYALQMCLKVGAKVICTVGDDDKKNSLQKLFPNIPSHCIIVRNNQTQSFGELLDKCLAYYDSKTIDIVLDSLLGNYFNEAFKRLAPMGKHIVFGAAALTPKGDSPFSLFSFDWLRLAKGYITRPHVDVMNMISSNVSVIGFNLIWLWNESDLMNNYLNHFLSLNLPPPYIDSSKIFDFHDAPIALRIFKSGNTVGKVLLKTTNAQTEN